MKDIVEELINSKPKEIIYEKFETNIDGKSFEIGIKRTDLGIFVYINGKGIGDYNGKPFWTIFFARWYFNKLKKKYGK